LEGSRKGGGGKESKKGQTLEKREKSQNNTAKMTNGLTLRTKKKKKEGEKPFP